MINTIRRFSNRLAGALVILSFVSQGAIMPANAASSMSVDSFLVGQVYSGFSLDSVKPEPEIVSTAYTFTHVKSGAHLLFVKNSDENKVFSIAFRTPVQDDTGVNHVIEHSVLCGSKNYPVKDPFITMNKQSLNTYLNAETTPNYTIYPLSSENNKDFRNLMSIYLDGVFFPNMLNNENIFKEEAWRYELSSKSDALKYNGIVYNEMKGDTSSPDQNLMGDIDKSLFPDTAYKFNSGGEPDSVPKLTYAHVVETYKKYYQPANSYIYLYGNVDLLSTLNFMDTSYLSGFDKKDAAGIDTTIQLQSGFKKPVSSTYTYPVTDATDTHNKTYLSLNYVIGHSTDKKTALGLDILNYLLLGSPASPLKNALNRNGLGDSAYGSFSTDTEQPVFSIIIKNTNEDQKEKFAQVVDATLKELVKNGIDRKLEDSLMNSIEISKRTANSNTQRGLAYDFGCMTYWAYGADPTAAIGMDSELKDIKSEIDKGGYFEGLITKNLLNNTHASLVVLNPQKGLQEAQDQKLVNSLAQYKKTLSADQIGGIVDQTSDFNKWFSEKDSAENTAKMPTLTRADLNSKQEIVPREEKELNGIKVLNHPLYTNGIGYTSLYFDAGKVPQDKIQYLSLLTNLLTQVSTNKHDYMALQSAINSNFGGLSFSLQTYRDFKDFSKYYPKLCVSSYTSSDKLTGSYELLAEIMNSSTFDDKEYLRQLIKQTKSGYEQYIANQPDAIVNSRAMSYTNDMSKYGDTAQGLAFYTFIQDLDKNFDAKYPEIAKNLSDTEDIVFNKDNLVVSFTGNSDDYGKFTESFKTLADALKTKKTEEQCYVFNNWPVNEGIIIPSQVQYDDVAGILTPSDMNDSGVLSVVETILNNGYLWDAIRTKGGAYGAGLSVNMDGTVVFSSYRDPQVTETFDAFNKTVDYLKNFKANDQEMINYIIGTIGKQDAPENPDVQALISDVRYIKGVPDDYLQKMRDQILSTTDKDVEKSADLIQKVIDQKKYGVMGGESAIDAHKNFFNAIVQPL